MSWEYYAEPPEPTREELKAEIERLRAAIAWIEPPFVDEKTPEAELRQRIAFAVADAKRAALEAPQGRIDTAQPAPPVSPWQPIDTAPKDGRCILLGRSRFTPELGWWDDEDVWLKGWHCGGGRSDTYGPGFDPTHWMPLPAAPGGDNEA